MDQLFGKVLEIMIAILFMFVVPICYFGVQQTKLCQSYVLELSAEFVNGCSSRGYISREMYQDFLVNLHNTGFLYEVSFYLNRRIYEPEYILDDKEALQFTGRINSSIVELLDTKKLNQYIESNSHYPLEYGDYITVKVRSTSNTIGVLLLRLFQKSLPEAWIYIEYGGTVYCSG